MPIPSDPLLANQWYLRNTAGGFDLDVTGVWDDGTVGPGHHGYTGAGIRVAVIDMSFDTGHSEFAGRYRSDLDWNFIENNGDPSATSSNTDESHGTAVMGIIGAGQNGTGTVGIAYDSELVGYRTLDTDHVAAAIGRSIGSIASGGSDSDVVNMSIGIIDGNHFFNHLNGVIYAPADIASLQALHDVLGTAAATGRDGLGLVMVQSAGNQREDFNGLVGRDVNDNVWSNSRHEIVVASAIGTGMVSNYSTPGANILVTALGGVYPGTIWTTDRTGTTGYDTGDYTGTFDGTSAAAPMVTGVVALMLEANVNLGWRDVQSILAYTARHVGSAVGAAPMGNEDYNWRRNGATDWNGGGLHFSNDYGYGLIDAHAAVRLAEHWNDFGQALTSANESSISAIGDWTGNIPDNTAAATQIQFTLAAGLSIESIVLTLGISHTNAGDIVILLRSPSGTFSTLIERPGQSATTPDGTDANFVGNWQFTNQSFRGEDSGGVWTLFVSDEVAGNTGSISVSDLTVHGTSNEFGSSNLINDTYVYTDEFSDYYTATSAGWAKDLVDLNGGVDTLNASAVTTASSIWLSRGVSTIDGIRFTAIDPNGAIENAIGGDGDDTINGSDADNRLIGGRGNDFLEGFAGADTLDGSSGKDFAVYSYAATGPVFVDLFAGTAHGGFAEGDQFISIEGLLGTTFNDSLTGDDFANDLYGGLGNDTLSGGGNADYLYGDDGDDVLDGGSGGDAIYGGDGNDTLTGGSGNDHLVGGAGWDVAVQPLARSAVTIARTTPYGNQWSLTQGGELDALWAVEAVQFNDVTVTLRQSHANFNFAAANDTGATSDILLQSGGTLVSWTVQNNGVVTGALIGAGAVGWTVKATADINADGDADIILQNGGDIVAWNMQNGAFANATLLGSGATGWNVVGATDIDSDGDQDLVLQNGGSIVSWTMQNGVVAGGQLLASGASGWTVVGTGDFWGLSNPPIPEQSGDLLLQNGGTIVAWKNVSGTIVGGSVLSTGVAGWSVKATGDFNGDGQTDIILQNGGTIVDWIVKDGVVTAAHLLGTGLTGWNVVAAGDYNGDGTSDVLLQNGGSIVVWDMQDGIVSGGVLTGSGASGWLVAA